MVRLRIRYGAWPTGLLALMLLFCVLLGPQVAQAAPARAGETPLQICIAPMKPADSLAATGAKAVTFDCAVRQVALGSGDYWIKLRPADDRPMAGGRQLRLAIDWQQSMAIHVRYQDGGYWSKRLDSAHVGEFIQLGSSVVVPLPASQSPIRSLIIGVRGAGNVAGVIGEAALVTPAAAQAMERKETAGFSSFVGLAAGLLVFNLVLWATLRERFQLFYCGMVASMIAYAFTSSGALHIIMPGLDSNDRLRLSYLALSGAASLGLLFAVNFFESGIIPRWVRHASTATIILIVGSGVAFAVLAPVMLTQIDRLFLYSFVPAPALVVILFGYAWRRKSRFAGLFLLAWSAPLIMMTMRILHSARIIDVGFVMEQGTLLAMACESLLSSLAMSFRIKLMRRERDVARGEELYARRLAEIDPQTSLFNRRALLARALESAGAQALLVIDIDHFKRINDSKGHDVGDDVLCAVARVIDAQTGPAGIAARLGGEEFAILMPAETVPNRFAEQMIRAVAAAPMPHGQQVTVSIGTATGVITSESEWQALYRSADQALYQAKNSGRNAVRHSWPTIAALAAA